MLKFEYMRFIFQRAKQTEIVRAIAFTIILFIILGQIAVRFNLVRAIGLYSAQGVIGQLEYSTITEYSPDLSESSFGANNNSVTANALGFNFPGEIAVDYTNNRMFVADTGNSRVLVFNLNSENQIIDYEADYVLGQVDFLNNDTETTIINLNAPTYLAIDQDNQLLYVSDTGNNRIMIFNIEDVSNGEPAVNVLGQLDFDTSSSRLKDNGLNQPLGIVLDSSGGKLFVADSENNRVLVFETENISNGSSAINVLGQVDGFEVNGSGNDEFSLNAPHDLSYDSSTNSLFVADSQNNRIMVFDVSSISDGEPAVNVLGQANFEVVGVGSGSAGLNTPQGLEFGNNSLFVADSQNNRIMVFDVSSISDGEPAVNVLGQVDFDALDFDWPANSLKIFGSFFSSGSLYGVYLNTSTDELYVSDQFSNRIAVFDVSSISDGETFLNVLGFYTEAEVDVFGDPTYIQNRESSGGASTNQYGFSDVVSVEIDTVNHRLFVASSNNVGRILVFNLNSENQIIDYEADYVLGQVDFVSSGNSSDSSGFDSLHDLVFDSINNYLYVADSASDRVLVFDVSSITNNEPAIHVLGQQDFDVMNNSEVVDQSTLDYPTGLSLDSENNKLFVADSQNNRIMVFDVSSISDGEPAVNVLGQVDFVTENSNIDASSFNLPTAVSIDRTNKKLYVVDKQNFRIMVFDVSSISDGEPAVNVLGSNSFTGSSAGTTDSLFDFSSGFFELPDIFINPNNQKLFISDSGNNRVLVFDVSSISDGEPAVAVIGQDDFNSLASDVSQTSLSIPKGIASDLDSNRIFVADSGNFRVLEFGFLEITTNSFEEAVSGETYTQEINTSYSQGVVSYELYSGELPPGLALVGDQITGVPTDEVNSSYNFSIIAKDSVSNIGTFYSNPVEFSISVLGVGGGSGGNSGSSGNIYPVVEINNPTQNAVFSESNINVYVRAFDLDGNIKNVQLFLDGILFSEKDTYPYNFLLKNLSFGSHKIFARAYDNYNASTDSSEVYFLRKEFLPDLDNTKECSDGKDNDLDQAIDFPDDLGCSSSSDNSEKEVILQISECSDGIDNDEDGFTDMGDVGCINQTDNNEFNQNLLDKEEELDPCELGGEACDAAVVNVINTKKELNPVSICSPGLFNSAACITKESLEYTKEVLGVSIVNAWDVINSPYGNTLTKTISVVSLIFGAIFTVLPVLFINPLSFSEILLIPLRLWSLLLSALGIKKKIRKWGIVYDSVTKRPLDPVYVSLQDVERNEIASSITDLDGRYGFLVEPGKYRIVPKKTNYSFPSLKMVGKTRDEIYLDLYFGYVFEITEQGGVITKNIPMDPITFDWNEFTKEEKKLTSFYSKRDVVMNKIADFVFSVGFVMAIIALISAPIIYNILIFILYIGLMVFREIGFRQKKSGKIIRKGTDIPLAYAIIRVFDFNTNTEIIQRVTDKIGKFFCLVSKGEYYITIEGKESDGSYKKIFKSEKLKIQDGIIDNTFEV